MSENLVEPMTDEEIKEAAADVVLLRIRRLESELATCHERVAKLEATLDGDPSMTATPEERRAWRASAVRYADKAENELDQCRQELAAVREEHDVALMSMTDYRAEAEHQERERAAAEAREQKAINLANGALAHWPMNKSYIAGILEALERADHAALNAALEQARIGGGKIGYEKACVPMSCGHPRAAHHEDMASARCSWCESLEQARLDARYEAYGDMLDAVISDWRERYSEPMTIGEVESIVRMYVEKALEQARREVLEEARINVSDDLAKDDLAHVEFDMTIGEYVENMADVKAEGAAEERERWEPAVNLAMEWAAGYPLGGYMDAKAAADVYQTCDQAIREGDVDNAGDNDAA